MPMAAGWKPEDVRIADAAELPLHPAARPAFEAWSRAWTSCAGHETAARGAVVAIAAMAPEGPAVVGGFGAYLRALAGEEGILAVVLPFAAEAAVLEMARAELAILLRAASLPAAMAGEISRSLAGMSADIPAGEAGARDAGSRLDGPPPFRVPRAAEGTQFERAVAKFRASLAGPP
ncbi:hypothetical protein [Poseidonocella sp. HB161398]|uniref:hypothetical protein n=1 Tax=Poseidonocella sp. HB161398 TaxID=2320855 RepID=UPI001108E2AD|nr:hypothetical protein [Poseidonocella sp. HB161398]